jgi:hypothetical protein
VEHINSGSVLVKNPEEAATKVHARREIQVCHGDPCEKEEERGVGSYCHKKDKKNSYRDKSM